MGQEFQIINNIPQEYRALSDALSEFFYACGSRTLCGACFAGKLHDGGVFVKWEPGGNEEYQQVSKGCCGTCENLGPQGCRQKPVGCAGFTCGALGMMVPRRLAHIVKRAQGYVFESGRMWIIGGGCYPCTLRNVAEYPYKKADLARMKRATQQVKRATKWIRLSGWHPNWPLMERITKADAGAFAGVA